MGSNPFRRKPSNDKLKNILVEVRLNKEMNGTKQASINENVRFPLM